MNILIVTNAVGDLAISRLKTSIDSVKKFNNPNLKVYVIPHGMQARMAINNAGIDNVSAPVLCTIESGFDNLRNLAVTKALDFFKLSPLEHVMFLDADDTLERLINIDSLSDRMVYTMRVNYYTLGNVADRPMIFQPAYYNYVRAIGDHINVEKPFIDTHRIGDYRVGVEVSRVNIERDERILKRTFAYTLDKYLRGIYSYDKMVHEITKYSEDADRLKQDQWLIDTVLPAKTEIVS